MFISLLNPGLASIIDLIKEIEDQFDASVNGVSGWPGRNESFHDELISYLINLMFTVFKS